MCSSMMLSAAIFCDESFIIGLLQVTEYAENLRPSGMVSFIHKSIQEFLAAWYIACCVPNGNLGGIERHALSSPWRIFRLGRKFSSLFVVCLMMEK